MYKGHNDIQAYCVPPTPNYKRYLQPCFLIVGDCGLWQFYCPQFSFHHHPQIHVAICKHTHTHTCTHIYTCIQLFFHHKTLCKVSPPLRCYVPYTLLPYVALHSPSPSCTCTYMYPPLCCNEPLPCIAMYSSLIWPCNPPISTLAL